MSNLVDLPDVNVWLAFAVAEHVHHERARRYWYEEAREQLAFCRVTSLGLLRLLTNTTAMGGRPLSVRQAWHTYQAFRRLPEILLIDEPLHCENWMERWATEEGAKPRLWTDAYLAALSRAGGLRLVSFDRDFSSFEGVEILLLEA